MLHKKLLHNYSNSCLILPPPPTVSMMMMTTTKAMMMTTTQAMMIATMKASDDGDGDQDEMFQPSSAQPARTMLTGQVEQNGLAKYVGEFPKPTFMLVGECLLIVGFIRIASWKDMSFPPPRG